MERYLIKDNTKAKEKENVDNQESETSESEEITEQPSTEEKENDENILKKLKAKSYNASRKFQEEWKNQNDWLTKDKDSERPYCKICHKVINGGISHIQRHQKTNIHERNLKKGFEYTSNS
ncbi:hypothetical protein NQ315_000522 [Exocentrus adspersus]|uniref:BED-type domain-containing protein n=1 Tax=Exocentrus adspersus TaxID=1586481 RepID=A0AAV8VCP2_9CUCU|nr:hypothetical protein NQ315_000522 [Exocentrus adspersus]